jgi:hypothetical protein
MKVNISYTVELEEVLPSTFSLYKDELKKFKKVSDEAFDTLESPFSEEHLIECLESIRKYSEASSKFNQKLAEINNILIGYAGIRYKQDVADVDQQKQREEEQND